MGSLIGIRPIGEFDRYGKTTVLGKAKGYKNAMEASLYYIEKTIENASEQTILIVHTRREKQALEYKEKIIERFLPKDVLIAECTPSCGINIGPGLWTAFYYGTPITDELATESRHGRRNGRQSYEVLRLRYAFRGAWQFGSYTLSIFSKEFPSL